MSFSFKENDLATRCDGCKAPFKPVKPTHRHCEICWKMMMVGKHTRKFTEVLGKANQQ